MYEKYDEQYEKQIQLLAEARVKSGNYKVFDRQARVIRRDKFPALKDAGRTYDETCLVIINKDGETIVITKEFEHILRTALRA